MNSGNKSPNGRLKLRYTISIVVAIVALPLATSALPPLPWTFEAGRPIVAAEVNANFEHLQSAISRLEDSNAELASANERLLNRGAYCNTTAEVSGRITAPGGLVGYRAAAALCATACGSPTAHMCSSEEVLRNVHGDVPEGWYSSGVYSFMYYASPTSYDNYNDCGGWTVDGNSGSSRYYGPQWRGRPSAASCSTRLPVICCD